jgi:hypothetical protein
MASDHTVPGMTQTSHDRTLLLLDIDGVLGPDTPHPAHGMPVRWADLPPGRMHFREDLIALLANLPDTIEPRWLTSWQDDVTSHLAPALGLPTWHAHRRSDARFGPTWTSWWKERVVASHLGQGRRVVWADDEIQWRADTDWAELCWPGQLTALSPDPIFGIPPEDLQAALAS